MNPKVTILRMRLVACLIWLVCGIIQGGGLGYATAVASTLFLIGLLMEAGMQ